MTDITPVFIELVTEKCKSTGSTPPSQPPSTETADEFLKEAHRINSHIQSLLSYLHSIRHSYLSIANPKSATTKKSRRASTPTPTTPTSPSPTPTQQKQRHLTDTERDSIDTSTALLLRDLTSSITNLSSAETLRQQTESTLLHRKYGFTRNLLWRWAGGGGGDDGSNANKTPEQVRDEGVAWTVRTVREGVLWFLNRELEGVAKLQGGMVERRIERVREKERSVLYMNRSDGGGGGGGGGGAAVGSTSTSTSAGTSAGNSAGAGAGVGVVADAKIPSYRVHDESSLSQSEVAEIESQLSPEQLQLFAEENDFMLRHYEDTLGKVQNAEKSLLEIASLQQTLVGHLATQEDYIGQLVTDAESMETNVKSGNKELTRATERQSTAQVVFWGTVGLCTWLVFWDLIF